MRFIQKSSYSCAKTLQVQLRENYGRLRVYYFGFQIIIAAAVKGITLVALSLLFGIFTPVMIIAPVFASLRVLDGGYHMDPMVICLVHFNSR